MTEQSDRQIDEIWKNNRDEYRKLILTALRVMTDATLPSPGDVSRSHASEKNLSDNIRLELGTIDRKGTGESVPYARLVPKNWNGNTVVWTQTSGKSGLFDSEGNPTGEAAYLVARGNAVIAPDLFMTGENQDPKIIATRQSKARSSNQNYAGFVYGYNRSTLAERVEDLLSTLAFARATEGTKSVQLVASGKSAPAAVLARAIAQDAIDRAAIDLGGFDFDRVTDPLDEMMLPGALKYGGINGFAAVCTHGQTLLIGGRRDTSAYSRVAVTPQINLQVEAGGPESMVDWLEQK